MTRSQFKEILTVLTKYLFDLGVRLTEFSVTVESVTLRFYCTYKWLLLPMAHFFLHSVSHHDIFFFNNAFYKLVKTNFDS